MELVSEFRFSLSASATCLLDIGGVPAGGRIVDLLGEGTSKAHA